MTVQEAIKFIVNKRDKNLLTDSKKFKAYLQDLCSDDNPKELKIINRALEDKILARIFGNERDNVKIARLRDEFEDQGLSETWSDFIISSFAQVLGWNYSNKVSTQNNSIQPNCEEGILTKEILQQLDSNYEQKTSINIPETCVYNTSQQNGNTTEYKIKYIKITGIGEDLFQECDSLKSITIPDGVKTIGANAFNGCSSLTQINIPQGVEIIGANAFSNCYSLKQITIPNSVTTIETGAFLSCNSLKEIKIPSSVNTIGSILKKRDYTSDGVFQDCSSLTKVNIPEGVTIIGDNTFSGCSSLKEIIIPDSVTNIGQEAFSNCGSSYTETIVYYDGDAKGSPWGADKHISIKDQIVSCNRELNKIIKTIEKINKRYPNDNQLESKSRNNKSIADQVSNMISLLKQGLEFTKKFKI